MTSTSRRRFMQDGLAALTLPFLAKRALAQATRPNILFCISDDQSFPHAGAYGCPWVKTPGFDRVAKEGILFTHCYTPNAKCSPSRACILTGRNSWQLEEAANHIPYFPEKFATYPEALESNGYHVGFTGKGWAPGDPGMRDGKKRQLTGKPYQDKKLQSPTNSISNKDYTENFKAFMADKNNGQPFCFWYGSHEPHRRYEYGSGIHKGGKNPEELDRVLSFWPDNPTVRTDMLDYAYEIEHFDYHLVKILEHLEAIGELDNTIIVVTSDNGMPFPRVKGQKYEHSNHMPLAIMWKDGIQNPGRVVDDYVSSIDFAPTFLAAAGLNLEDEMEPSPGMDLADIFTSSKDGRVNPSRDHVLIGKERHDIGREDDTGYPVRGIVKDGYLYLSNYKTGRWPAGSPFTGYLNTDGSPTKTEVLNTRWDSRPGKYFELNFGKRPHEELYYLKTDMDCVNNLAEHPQYRQIKERLKAQMLKELFDQDDPRVMGNGTIFDEYEYADDVWRDFYNKKKAGDRRVPGWINASDFDREE